MAQTTGAIDRANFEVEVSTDGTTWNKIDSEATTVAASGGDQITGSVNTADGNAPIVTAGGKTGPITLTFNGVYTKTSNEAFDRLRDRFEDATPGNRTMYVRYAPEGGIGSVAGNDLFTCTNDAGSAFAAPIINCLPPEVDAGSGDPAMFTFSVLTPDLARSATTTS